jgi:phospholipid-binding lipoprotein MlaA
MLKNKENFFRYILLSALIFGMTGCATNSGHVNQQDPYEHVNRKIFAFNMAVDRAFLRPIAKTYDVVFPWQVKKGVYNFFHNVGDVTSAANEILQLDFRQAIADLARVVINTTIGIGGLFDVATKLGIERDIEDFGMTLARWGSKNTPYIVLPFFGPSTIRDAVGLPINCFLLSPWGHINSPEWSYSYAGLYVVQRRATLLVGDKLIDQAFDPYVFIRDAYLQRREFLIEEGEERNVNQYDKGKSVKMRKNNTPHSSGIIY